MNTKLLGEPSAESPSGGLFSYVSASRLNCWLACPLKFRLQYLDRIRRPTTASLLVGKATHAALEVCYRQRQRGSDVAADAIADWLHERWDALAAEAEMAFASPAESQALREQTVDLVRAYAKAAPTDERPLAVESTLETPLVDPASGEDLGIPLVGIVDLIVESPVGPIVVDFKTSARSAPPLEISHEVQLSCYAYLLRRTAGREESSLEIRSLIKTRVPKVEFHRYPARTDAHFRRLFAIVWAYLDELDAGRFVFRPGLGCAMCDFRETHCRNWCG